MALNGKLIFNAQTDSGLNLWTSDGTAAGTYLLKDLQPGSNNSDLNTTIDRRNVYNGKLYFPGQTSYFNMLVSYVTDGTAAGTRWTCDSSSKMLQVGYVAGYDPTRWHLVNGILITTASEPATASGFELRRIDTGNAVTPPPAAVSGLLQAGTGLQLYPNPARGSVQVVSSLQQPQWEILDAVGRQLQSGRLAGGSGAIPLNGLAGGRYLIRLREGPLTETGVVVVLE